MIKRGEKRKRIYVRVERREKGSHRGRDVSR